MQLELTVTRTLGGLLGGNRALNSQGSDFIKFSSADTPTQTSVPNNVQIFTYFDISDILIILLQDFTLTQLYEKQNLMLKTLMYVIL